MTSDPYFAIAPRYPVADERNDDWPECAGGFDENAPTVPLAILKALVAALIATKEQPR